jgi:PAS domain S-box-containing protein
MSPELLATHEILTLFEKSKSLADQFFDNLSGIFCNIDRYGTVQRANEALARHFKVDLEDILGMNISTLFTPRDWPEFFKNFSQIVAGHRTSIEFEMPIQYEGRERSFLWQISPLQQTRQENQTAAFTCLGKDISDVKEALAQVVLLEKDLELTKAMQDLLLPQNYEINFGNLGIVASYKSAGISGGDFWWLERADEERLWIITADVTGHGAGAAMVTAMVAGTIETMNDGRKSGTKVDMPGILGAINQRLRALPNAPYWMTATALEFNMKDKICHWWGAASPPIFMIQADMTIETVSEPSSPLGETNFALADGKIILAPGQRILMLTDGVLEARNAKGLFFGTRGVSRFLKETRSVPPAMARTELLHRLREWVGDAPDQDDTMFVIIDYFES